MFNAEAVLLWLDLVSILDFLSKGKDWASDRFYDRGRDQLEDRATHLFPMILDRLLSKMRLRFLTAIWTQKLNLNVVRRYTAWSQFLNKWLNLGLR